MFEGRDLRRLGREGLRRLRGRSIAIVPQAAMSLLNPTMRVITQSDRVRRRDARRSGRSRAGRHRGRTHRTGTRRPRPRRDSPRPPPGIPARTEWWAAPAGRARAGHPEPAAAADRRRNPPPGSDVVTQWEILDLLDELRAEFRFDVLLISHDLPLVAAGADDLAIMYAGRIVERGATRSVLERPLHPYTRRLIDAVGTVTGPRRRPKPIAGEPPDPRRLPEGCALRSPLPAPQRHLHCRGPPIANRRRCNGGLSPRPAGSLDSEQHRGRHLVGRRGRHRGRLRAGHRTWRIERLGDRRSPRYAHRGHLVSDTLRLRDVDVLYGPRGRGVMALRGVSFTVRRGERVALVGRSGAGEEHHRPPGGRPDRADGRLGGGSGAAARRAAPRSAPRAAPPGADHLPGSLPVAASRTGGPPHRGRTPGRGRHGARPAAGRRCRCARGSGSATRGAVPGPLPGRRSAGVNASASPSPERSSPAPN